jgi:ABC-type glycerol-3-phosphate transport system permease component
MNRSYYWLITALSIPAFLWLIPTLWMVSLSFQPNEVLARTTSTTAFGLIPYAVHRRELRSALQPSARRRCGF